MGDGQRLIEAAQEAARRCDNIGEISRLPENDQVTAWAHAEVRSLLTATLNTCVATEIGDTEHQQIFTDMAMAHMADYGQLEALTVFNCTLYWLAAALRDQHCGRDGTYVELAEKSRNGELNANANDPLFRLFKEEKE